MQPIQASTPSARSSTNIDFGKYLSLTTKKVAKLGIVLFAVGWLAYEVSKTIKTEGTVGFQNSIEKTPFVGVGLGTLALISGVSEFVRYTSLRASAPDFFNMNHRISTIGLLACNSFSNQVEAEPVGTEFQINTYTISDQKFPRVAPLSDSDFVVVWQSDLQDGDGWGIFGQRFATNRSRLGNEFQINSYTASSQEYPKVIPLLNDSFLVGWQSYFQDGGGYGVYGQAYEKNGEQRNAEFQLNTYTNLDHQFRPSLTPFSDGSFLSIWIDNGQDGSLYGIYGQKFSSDFTPVASEFQVNSYTLGNQHLNAITALPGDKFVAVWESTGQDGDSVGVYGQKFHANGSFWESEFQINTNTTGIQDNPQLTALIDGSFVVVWQSFPNSNSTRDVLGQKYSPNGIPEEREFKVNSFLEGGQKHPSISAVEDGGFFVVWESNGQDGDKGGIFGQRYSSLGAPIGGEFQINSQSVGDQQHPDITTLQDGTILVVWASENQDGDGYGIFGKRLNISDLSTTPSPSPSTSESSTQEATMGMLNSTSSGSTSLSQGQSVNSTPSPSIPTGAGSLNTSSGAEESLSSSPSVISPSLRSASVPESTKVDEVETRFEPGSSTSYEAEITPVIEIEITPLTVHPYISEWQQLDGTLHVTFEDSLDFEDGEEMVLFTFANGEGSWSDLTLVADAGSCTVINNRIEDNGDGTSSYIAIFEINGCNTNSGDQVQLSWMGKFLAFFSGIFGN